MTFGDGTPFSDDERRAWIDLYDRQGTPILWNVGDVAIVCNDRFAHGRQGIELADGEARTLGWSWVSHTSASGLTRRMVIKGCVPAATAWSPRP